MKTRLEQPIKIGSAQLDRLALLEDTTGGTSSPRGYQKPTRKENMMYSNAKFVEQEAQQQQVNQPWLSMSLTYTQYAYLAKILITTYISLHSVRGLIDVDAGAGPATGWRNAHSTEYARDCKYNERRAGRPVYTPRRPGRTCRSDCRKSPKGHEAHEPLHQAERRYSINGSHTFVAGRRMDGNWNSSQLLFFELFRNKGVLLHRDFDHGPYHPVDFDHCCVVKEKQDSRNQQHNKTNTCTKYNPPSPNSLCHAFVLLYRLM